MANLTNFLLDLVLAVAPAGLVYLTATRLFESFLQQQLQQQQVQQRLAQQERSFPLRLQAYERLTLLCERLALPNLLLRLRPDGFTVAEYQVALLMNIQEEFEHNLTQQVYISDQLWQILKIARDDSVNMVALAAAALEPRAEGRLLGEKIMGLLEQRGTTAVDTALQAIKKEAATLFS